MCNITIAEFKNNIKYYLELSNNEDVYIMKNNEIVSVLVNPQKLALYEAIKDIESLDVPKNLESNNKILEEALLERYIN